MKLRKISAQNYKGINNLVINLSDKTLISGKNASGKTTVMNIVYDILTDKMADGSSTANIRPKTKDGQDKNDYPIIRAVSFDLDGQKHEIRKITVKKMVQDRQTGGKVFKGNDTSYEIDDFPYKKKDFDKWIDENFSKDTFAYCLNPQSFLNLMSKNTGDARKALAKISGYDPDNFISENPQYAGIADMMKGHTAEETKKVIKKKIKGIESNIELNSKILSDLQSKEFNIPDSDKAENIRRKIETLEGDLSKVKTTLAQLDDEADEALQLKIKQGDILRDANQELINRRSTLNNAIDELKVTLAKTKSEISEYTTRNFNIEESLKELNIDVLDYEKKIQDAKQMSLSEDSKICPYCGNKLSDTDIAEKVKDFEAKKQASIEMLNKFRIEADESINKYQQEYQRNKDHITLLSERIKPLEEQIKILSGQLEQLPYEKKASDIPEYQEVGNKIDAICKKLSSVSELKKQKREIEDGIQICNRQISDLQYEYEKVSSAKDENDKAIEETSDRIKSLRQDYANCLKDITMISEFAIASNKDMQDRVNHFFKHFKFELFDTTQAGDIVETCRMMVNGIPYGLGLNHGDMILAEIDLVQGFQKMLNTEMPIFVDDAESVDEDRIPDISGQLIILRRTDNNLTIEEV